jgi:uncharacterized membrane protein
MIEFLRGMLWNIFLAAVPVALGYSAAAVGYRMLRQRAWWLWLALAPLLALWLVFLPNSCYLFTEPRHLLQAVESENLWTRARDEPGAALRLALWTMVALVYSVAGALTFALAIRPLKALARRAGLAAAWWAAPFFVLMSVGVYLGLVVRYNSWDLLTRPGEVLQTVLSLTGRPMLVSGILLIGLCLWAAYELIDIWIDGFVVRWERWTRQSSGRAAPDLASLPS